jgi:hypothetical protein
LRIAAIKSLRACGAYFLILLVFMLKPLIND